MKNGKKLMEKIRAAEAELVFADPKRAGKLASLIAKGKAKAFN